jgi:hypothetical protein
MRWGGLKENLRFESWKNHTKIIWDQKKMLKLECLKERLKIVENIYFTECIRAIVVRSERFHSEDEFPLFLALVDNAVLTHGHAGQLPRDPASTGFHANLCMLWLAVNK